jgi:hypothetical protein
MARGGCHVSGSCSRCGCGRGARVQVRLFCRRFWLRAGVIRFEIMSSMQVVGKRVLASLLGAALWVALAAPGVAGATAASGEVSMEPRASELKQGAAPACIPREQCCRTCTKGKACGNSCISEKF